MNFDFDIIIAYSADDDVANGNNGWVSQYSSNLKTFLSQLLGASPNVFLLNEKTANSINDFSSGAIFMPLLSNNFMYSEKCLSLLEEFIEHTKSDLKSSLGIDKRIVKVYLEPVEEDELPLKIQDQLGFEFFSPNTSTAGVNRFEDQKTEKIYTTDYWLKMTDVVFQCRQTLGEVSIGASSTGGGRQTLKDKIIYLAETGDDLSVERNMIRREFINHGYKVLPDQPYAHKSKGLSRQIEKDIEHSDLYIQLVGNDYGISVEGEDKSIPEIQYHCSFAKSSSIQSKMENEVLDKSFYRIMWIHAEIETMSFVQKKFYDQIVSGESGSDNLEILEGTIEQLKRVALKQLRMTLKKETARHYGSANPNIYLMVSKEQKKECEKIERLLIDNGFEVTTSSYNGGVIQMLRDHESKLRSCDSSLILYDDTNEDWLNAKFKDVLRAGGLGREAPISTNAIVSKGKIDNPLLSASKAILIENTPEITEASLKPFFHSIDPIK